MMTANIDNKDGKRTRNRDRSLSLVPPKIRRFRLESLSFYDDSNDHEATDAHSGQQPVCFKGQTSKMSPLLADDRALIYQL